MTSIPNGAARTDGGGPLSGVSLGFGEWGFRAQPLENHFASARRLGLGVMEFGIGADHLWPGRVPAAPDADRIRSFRALADRNGITTPFAVVENDFTFSSSVRVEAEVQKVLSAIATAHKCDATHLRIFAGMRPWEKMNETIWTTVLDALDTCASAARGLGMELAVETHGLITMAQDGSELHHHTMTTHPEGIARLHREMPVGVGFNYDPGNLRAVAPGDPTCAAELVRGRVNYCHLKDWSRVGTGWRTVAPGDDSLDWVGVLQLAGYEGVALLEYEPMEDAEAGTRRGLEYLSSLGAAPVPPHARNEAPA